MSEHVTLDGPILRACLEELEGRRRDRQRRARAAQAAFLARHPAVDAARRALAAAGLSAARRALHEAVDPEETQKARARYDELRTAALSEDGLTERDLAPPPDCPRCGDTGFTGEDRRLCGCIVSAALARMNQSARLRDDYTFESFDLSLFPDEEVLPCGQTQRAQMEQVRRYCRRWARQYPDNPKPWLLLTGIAGLGKTFLLHSIAHAVMDGGKGAVLSTTAFHIVAEARNGFDALGNLQVYLEAPLLLIDDLGTEPRIAGITNETLFTVLNERQAARRSTLLSTNLSLPELSARYGERILSRLVQRDTAVIRLEGRDLRRLKPEK